MMPLFSDAISTHFNHNVWRKSKDRTVLRKGQDRKKDDT